MKTYVRMLTNSLTQSADKYHLIVAATHCMAEVCTNYEYVENRKEKHLITADEYRFNWPGKKNAVQFFQYKIVYKSQCNS